MNHNLRGGMQVHAVPDEERVVDSSGRQLPWGYSYAEYFYVDPLNPPSNADLLCFASSTLNRKQPLEKGPFGKSTARRAGTRGRTPAAPTTEKQRLKLEDRKAQDSVFGKLKVSLDEEEQRQSQTRQRSFARAETGSDRSRSPGASGDVGAGGLGPQSSPSKSAAALTHGATAELADPTEVLIYGYAPSSFPVAISFYETASRGHIYEDYDRGGGHGAVAPRFTSALSSARSAIPKSLPPAARRKINEYRGGDHWIKVTFDSPQAAELACHESPHIIGGCLVYAEMWHGVGPSRDVAMLSGAGSGGQPAAVAGTVREGLGRQAVGRTSSSQQAAGQNFGSVPARMHGQQSAKSPLATAEMAEVNNNYNGSASTSTLDGSSVTANGRGEKGETSANLNAFASAFQKSQASEQPAARERRPFGEGDELLEEPTRGPSRNQRQPQQYHQPSDSPTPPANDRQRHANASGRPLRIPTATRVTLQPASTALLPVPPWTTRTFGHIPLIGPLFFSGGVSQTPSGTGMIGSTVPKNDRGEFDWHNASLWWCFCWWVDSWIGTDLCGLRGDD
ncbi:MAG: hypothetical protein M1831_004562 [Alyxoria varia]|nr:MAG: hypothetical protein M1831_004562 [Alyxoria varia]